MSSYDELGNGYHIDIDTMQGWRRLEPTYTSVEIALKAFEMMPKQQEGLRLRVRGPAKGNATGTIYAESNDGNVFRYSAGRQFTNHI